MSADDCPGVPAPDAESGLDGTCVLTAAAGAQWARSVLHLTFSRLSKHLHLSDSQLFAIGQSGHPIYRWLFTLSSESDSIELEGG